MASKVLSYDLRPVLTSRGTTALTGLINGAKAFVPSYSTVAEFDQAVKDDKVVLSGFSEGGKEVKWTNPATQKEETFISQGSFTWIRKAHVQTAAEKLAMQELVEGMLGREKTGRVDTATEVFTAVKSRLDRMREQAAAQELAQQQEADIAAGVGTEPVLAEA